MRNARMRQVFQIGTCNDTDGLSRVRVIHSHRRSILDGRSR